MLTKREIQVIQLRKKGLTQEKIAKKLKLSQPAISAFENNAHKKIKQAREIIQIYKKIGVNVED